MDERIDVHDTAFMTSTFRASNEALSKDPYARLWINGNAERWSQDYLDQVSQEEAAAHCMRNRYFLDRIKELHAAGKIDVLINFGSGFSMYPYLLLESLLNIEIDKREVIDHKKVRTMEWQDNGALPERNIQYISVDFTTDFQDDLRSELMGSVTGLSSFILLEGVLFFLKRTASERLFEFFSSIQGVKGYIGSASFRPELTSTTAWSRLMRFVDRTTAATDDTFSLTLEDEFYRDRKGYELLEVQDFFSLSSEHGHQPQLPVDEILNECFYLLKKV